MSASNDYSADEWKAISASPMAVGLAIALSEMSGPNASAIDPVVVSRAITRSGLVDAPEIVRVLVERVRAGTDGFELPDLASIDRPETTEALIEIVGSAVRAIEVKSPGETEPFKAWLASVAAKVCHATSPVSGAIKVTRGQQDIIDRLARILGVPRAPRSSGVDRTAGTRRYARPNRVQLPPRFTRMATSLLVSQTRSPL
jgi:hypothetical protein